MYLSLKKPYVFSAKYRQAGVALITVLMVFAIASIIATKVITAKMLDTQRLTGMLSRTQAYYYSLAAEELAILALRENTKKDTEDNRLVDDLDELWAGNQLSNEIDSQGVDNIGTVQVKINDLNRFYNLNNIVDEEGTVIEAELVRFRHLLEELDIDVLLADNLRDWLDKDDQESGYASESDAYYSAEPAYRAANRRMTDISELFMVAGFTSEVIKKLFPHVTVVESRGILPVNVNTATRYVLAASDLTTQTKSKQTESIGVSGASDIETSRPYNNRQEMQAAVSGGDKLILTSATSTTSEDTSESGSGQSSNNQERYSVTSDYFEINIRATYAGHTAFLTTVVKQEGLGEAAKFIVLSRRESDNSLKFLQ